MRREIFQSFGLLIGGTPCVSVSAFSVAAQGTPSKPRFPGKTRAQNFRQNYMSAKVGWALGFIDCLDAFIRHSFIE